MGRKYEIEVVAGDPKTKKKTTFVFTADEKDICGNGHPVDFLERRAANKYAKRHGILGYIVKTTNRTTKMLRSQSSLSNPWWI